MRRQFVKTVDELLSKDERLVVLLGDIGVFGFRKHLVENKDPTNSFPGFSDRVYNIGILEQSTISMAAGLAMDGFIPVVHTIAPFIVERALEQIKDDFGYQQLGGNFVSVGASYDYSALGCTHHCPGDVGILKNVPEVEIVLPGTASEFDLLFKQAYANGHPTYFRLAEQSNAVGLPVEFGKAHLIKSGSRATVIAVGPMLDRVVEACTDLDVTILYYTTLSPFDRESLSKHIAADTVIVCEPYYSGALDFDIRASLPGRKIRIEHIGVPREFLRHYGEVGEQDAHLGLTAPLMHSKITEILV